MRGLPLTYPGATIDRLGGYLVIYLFRPELKCGGYLWHTRRYLWQTWELPCNFPISARIQMRGLPLMYLGATFDRPGGYLAIYFFRPDFHITVWHTWGLCYLVLPDFKDVGYLWCAWGLPTKLLISARFQMTIWHTRGLPTKLLIFARFQGWGLPLMYLCQWQSLLYESP